MKHSSFLTKELQHWELHSHGLITSAFSALGANDYKSAAFLVQSLPYKRNQDKLHPLAVLQEQCGTCSSKHILLKKLAEENQLNDVQLILGIFMMNALNTPAVKSTLHNARVEGIPEANCYLKVNHQIFDFTNQHLLPEHYVPYLLKEVRVEADDLQQHKADYHKAYLAQWLTQQVDCTLTLESVWQLREQCIRDLEYKSES